MMSLARPAAASSTADDMYSERFLKPLFDAMQGSYERVSDWCSFGFNRRWRRQCSELLPLIPGMRVCDLMSGTGEVWMDVLPRIGPSGCLISIDFSREMVRNAWRRRARLPRYEIHVQEEDALASSVPDASMDAVICTYGVKTLGPAQRRAFACEIRRMLKPGGFFALVEISMPSNPLLQSLYMTYLHKVIPGIGRLCLGNPDSYRMLSYYLRNFRDCGALQAELEQAGLPTRSVPFFFGCATALAGQKPL